jgi:hypothetical protein
MDAKQLGGLLAGGDLIGGEYVERVKSLALVAIGLVFE